jgi:hypothetical protein
MDRTRGRRRGSVKLAAAAITVCFVLSLALATPAVAKTKPKGLSKVDLHALIACTGLDVSANGAYFLGQPPNAGVLFNIVTGLTRSKTRGAHKQAENVQAATGEAQFTAINDALTWCTGRGYTRRTR